MESKRVILIRKQNTPFTVNYPTDTGVKPYVWTGTQGKLLNERAVPIEVAEWLRHHTTTFQDGCLLIKDSDDIDIQDIKDNVPDIEKIESAIMTKDEIIELLTTGNHLSMQKKLRELVEDKPQSLVSNIKRQVSGIAQEIGIDSNAKRKILANWLGIDYENSDILFDREIADLYEKDN